MIASIEKSNYVIGAMPLAVSLCISVYTGPDQKDTKKALEREEHLLLEFGFCFASPD
jgi:hypothetical protein